MSVVGVSDDAVDGELTTVVGGFVGTDVVFTVVVGGFLEADVVTTAVVGVFIDAANV